MHLHGPFTGFEWVAPSSFVSTSLWGQSPLLHHIWNSKNCTSHQPEPTLHDHWALLCSAGCLHQTAQPGGVCIHFQIWSPFKTSRERKILWLALRPSRGGLRSTGGFEATIPAENQLCFSLPQNPLEWTQWGLLFKMLYWSNSQKLIRALGLEGSFNKIFSFSVLILIKPRDSVKMGAVLQSFTPQFSIEGNFTSYLSSLDE